MSGFRFQGTSFGGFGEPSGGKQIGNSPAATSIALPATSIPETPVEVKNLPALTILNKTDMVDLIVGPEEALFRVHKSFLCNKILYFDEMFNGGFKEAKENSAKFPEDFSESFDIFVEWVYSGRIRFYEAGVNEIPENWNLLGFYALAEKLGLTELEDRVLDIYRRSCRAKNSTFNMDWATKAYQITRQGSALRRYAIQKLVWRFHTQENSSFSHNDHFIKTMQSDNDLFTDFMLALRKHVKVVTPTDPRIINSNIPFSKCEYHNHIRDDDCYRSKRT